MKKYLVFILTVVLIFGLGSVALAATDSDDVTVTVEAIDLLNVPATTALTLGTTTPGAEAYDQGTQTDTDGLKYSHNSATGKKITALAVANVGDDPNDITLTVAIEGQTAGTIVDAGTVVESAVQLWTGIEAGSYTLDLDWTADATLAETLAGDYIWTVTFTTADAA